LGGAGALTLAGAGCTTQRHRRTGVLVNDVQSQLNPTWVSEVIAVDSPLGLEEALERSDRIGKSISVAGGRHAMGGQQFGSATVNLDTRPMNHVLDFDAGSGLIRVEAGIQWPQLIEWCLRAQGGEKFTRWGIRQKQTGTDRLCLGGTLSANAHGRSLVCPPIVSDVESFTILTAGGRWHRCSRRENVELFCLAIGGYGLFGLIGEVTLRLSPRTKVRRDVCELMIDELMDAVESRVAQGHLYGDFQFLCDPASTQFLRRGILSTYEPVAPGTPIEVNRRELSDEDWGALIHQVHVDPGGAFDRYSRHYLSTSGQIYWSDLQQMVQYREDYHSMVDERMGARRRATEIITEIYVPRPHLTAFMAAAADALRDAAAPMVYGTIRLIEPDNETFLAWARERFACVIFNLHTTHSTKGVEESAEEFRELIDIAIRFGGSYYLTYHRFALRAQVERCYPQLRDFLRLKREWDPDNRFESDWHRHMSSLFSL
jgi:FAD/FMN-containing dehydrogenase